MNITLHHAVMGFEAQLEEFNEGRRSNDVRVFKCDGLAHVSFAGSGSNTPASQADKIARLIWVGSRVAAAFDAMQQPAPIRGKLSLKFDAHSGLEFSLIPDSEHPMDQAGVLDDFLKLLSTLTTRTVESLLRTVPASSWEELRALPPEEFDKLVKQASPESVAELL